MVFCNHNQTKISLFVSNSKNLNINNKISLSSFSEFLMHLIHQNELNQRERIDYFWNKFAEIFVAAKLYPKYFKNLIRIFNPAFYQKSTFLFDLKKSALETENLGKHFFINLKFFGPIVNILNKSVLDIINLNMGLILDHQIISKFSDSLREFLMIEENVSGKIMSTGLSYQSRPSQLESFTSNVEIGKNLEILEILCAKLDLISYLSKNNLSQIIIDNENFIQSGEPKQSGNIEMLEIQDYFNFAKSIVIEIFQIEKNADIKSIAILLQSKKNASRERSRANRDTPKTRLQSIEKSDLLNSVAFQKLNNYHISKLLKICETMNESTHFIMPPASDYLFLFCLIGSHNTQFYLNLKPFVFIPEKNSQFSKEDGVIQRILSVFQEFKTVGLINNFNVGMSRMISRQYSKIHESQIAEVLFKKRRLIRNLKVTYLLI